MITVVLHKGSDYSKFRAMLDGVYNYKCYGSGRTFIIYTELDNFTLSNHEDIKHCYTTLPVNYEHAVSFDTQNDVITTYLGDSTTSPIRSWAKHRICRRTNPFRRESSLIDNTFTMKYGFTRTGLGVDVYIVDTGLTLDHVEFVGRVQRITGETTGADQQTQDAMDSGTNVYQAGAFHATNCVGCAIGNNLGIATGSQCFYVYAPAAGLGEDVFLDEYQAMYDHYLARANTNRPAVMSHSVAGAPNTIGKDPAVGAMLDDLMDVGMVVIFPAGNNKDDLDSESSYTGFVETNDDVIVVGAVGVHGTPMYNTRSGTGFGDKVDIYAPGQNVVCAWPENNNHYVSINGTSFAAPYTTGVVACMLEGYQRLTSKAQVMAVKQKLIDNSTKDMMIFPKTYYGENAILHNRFLYLDPFIPFEVIPGLNPL